MVGFTFTWRKELEQRAEFRNCDIEQKEKTEGVGMS